MITSVAKSHFVVNPASLYQSTNVYPVLIGFIGATNLSPYVMERSAIGLPPSVSNPTLYCFGISVTAVLVNGTNPAASKVNCAPVTFAAFLAPRLEKLMIPAFAVAVRVPVNVHAPTSFFVTVTAFVLSLTQTLP